MHANYNPVASFYDPLAKLVFGNAIRQSQYYLLSFIKLGAKVLLVGGGTGWILEEMAERCPQNLHITYVEHASRMMQKSRARNSGANEVVFVTQSILDFPLTDTYDVIFTPFLFDNFSEATAAKIITKLKPHHAAGGQWLFVDFDANGIASKGLLKLMYATLGKICSLETRQLPSMAELFKQAGYEKEQQKTFYAGMIKSIAYCRE